MENSIKRFIDWKNKWTDPSQMGIMNYISFNLHPEDILIVSRLFFPKLIEVDGCLFLEEAFNEENYTLWKQKLGKDRLTLEKTINHVHVYDIFANCADEVEDAVFEQIGRLLQVSWSDYFRQQFPAKEIIVDYLNDEQDYGPILSVYQGRA